jgi:hypothetical protein
LVFKNWHYVLRVPKYVGEAHMFVLIKDVHLFGKYMVYTDMQV